MIHTPYITERRVQVNAVSRSWMSRVTDASLRTALQQATSLGRRFVLVKCLKNWDEPNVEE